jgi:hypothetical protein
LHGIPQETLLFCIQGLCHPGLAPRIQIRQVATCQNMNAIDSLRPSSPFSDRYEEEVQRISPLAKARRVAAKSWLTEKNIQQSDSVTVCLKV